MTGLIDTQEFMEGFAKMLLGLYEDNVLDISLSVREGELGILVFASIADNVLGNGKFISLKEILNAEVSEPLLDDLSDIEALRNAAKLFMEAADKLEEIYHNEFE
jgi:hypothetical protein